MFRFLFCLFILFFLILSVYVYRDSQLTFEAKFKNIDGLPKSASVTTMGVKIGEVVRTRLTEDGIIVTIRITNKTIPTPKSGSQLTITSFRPNKGRVLEIIPQQEPTETKSWIIQEPITTESWLHASLDLLDDLKYFSRAIIKHFTPENFEKARMAFEEASDVLNTTAYNLLQYEATLIKIKEGFGEKASQANALLTRLQKPITSLNKLINDKQFTTSSKKELNVISKDLNQITKKITDPDFIINLKQLKLNVLTNLDEINNLLLSLNQRVSDPALKQKIKTFNEDIIKLNTFYQELNNKDIQKAVKEKVEEAKEFFTETSKIKQN